MFNMVQKVKRVINHIRGIFIPGCRGASAPKLIFQTTTTPENKAALIETARRVMRDHKKAFEYLADR